METDGVVYGDLVDIPARNFGGAYVPFRVEHPAHVRGHECGTCGAWCASIDVAIGACRARSPVVVNGGNRWPLTACGEACCEWRPRAEVKS